ncbi:MAG: S-layer homology domain-containing protein [Chloroflexia bacterium]
MAIFVYYPADSKASVLVNPLYENQQGAPVASAGLGSSSNMAPLTNAPDALQVLFDQMYGMGSDGMTSQEFEPDLSRYTAQAADDFVVPVGEQWNVTRVDVSGAYLGSGTAQTVNVYFYASTLVAPIQPATPIYTETHAIPTGGLPTGNFQVTLNSTLFLTEGHYWVSVQAQQDFRTSGQWFWRTHDSSLFTNEVAQWRNPGDGYHRNNCVLWRERWRCQGNSGAPVNQAFRLVGYTSNNVTPTATQVGGPPATATARPSATGTLSVPNPLLTVVAPLPTRTPTGVPPTVPAGTVPPEITPTVCAIQFQDVVLGSTFYAYVRCMVCQGIVDGYPCGAAGEPCNATNDPYFRPNNNVTRGQIAKIVANSAEFNEPVTGQSFEDVVPGSTFYEYIQRLSDRGIMKGYDCGDPEPCVAPGNRPYFRPNSDATRGQLAKIVANAANLTFAVEVQTFEDVPAGSTFYEYVERLMVLGVMSGYLCGGGGEPCVEPLNRPYFRPANNVKRGQTSKIVTNTFFPNCSTQGRSK